MGVTRRVGKERTGGVIKPHTHFIAILSGKSQLRFRDPRRFGGIWWLCDGEAEDANMGPEPLTIRPGQLIDALSKTRRAIKTALLDQGIVAGIGNIYADESLFH